MRAGLGPRFDFAVACEGPLVAAIAFTVTRLWWTVSVLQLKRRTASRPLEADLSPPLHGGVRAALRCAQLALYGDLVNCGVRIFEYTPSYLHAKVAVVAENWATVGSSNIDPYSLLLAREANVAVYDADFARELRRELESAIENESTAVDADACARRSWLRRTMSWVAYQLVRALTVVATRRDDG